MSSPFSWSFTTISPPTVVGTTPAAGATGVALKSMVTATFSEAVLPSSISFALVDAQNNPVAATLTYDATSHFASLTPAQPLAYTTTYTATVSGAQDVFGDPMTANVSWSFTTMAPDTTPPAVVSTSPLAGATGVLDASIVQVMFTEQVQASTISFTLSNGGTPVPATVSYDPAIQTVILDPVTNLAPATTYTVMLSGVEDLSGNTMTAASWSFTTAPADTTPPAVASSGPASGATGVPVASKVTATLTEDVQASTISVTLLNGATPVPATVSYDPSSRTVILDPAASLSPATTYTVMLSGAQDLSGNTMSLTSWSFTTAAANTTGPTVTVQTPATDATGVLVASNVTTTFSEDVQPSTISFLLQNGSTAVAAAVSYDPVTRMVTLDPTDSLAPATTYTAILSGVRDLFGNSMAPVSWSFTTAAVVTTVPTFTGQSPAVNATGVAISAPVTATFSAEVQANTISFVLKNGPTAVPSTISYNPATQTVNLTPTSSLAYATTYTAILSGAQDLWGNTMAPVSWSFTTTSAPDTTPPTVTAQSPAASATGVAIAIPVTATFSEEVQANTISFVLKNGSTTVASSLNYNPATQTATLTPSASLAYATTYTATLSAAQDLSDNTMSTISWSFTTTSAPDTTAPTVTARSPASGATGVVVASNVTATFSQDVQAGTISFVLKNGSTTVSAAVTYDVASRTVTLDPSSNLAAGTTYTATLSGAQDLSGNTMTSTSWSFTTAAADTTAPTASGQTPASGATGVPIATNVTATFSQDVQPGTISFVLKNGSTTVPATVTYDVASHIVILDPIANLAAGTTYTATLSGAQDLSGNTMTSTSWSFTTATADTTAPTVTAQIPASGATGVPADSVVTATFSEAIQRSTISFVLKNGSTTVPSTVTYDPTTRTVALDPNSNLAASTTYTATLSGTQDLSGNVMSTLTWSFTTAATPSSPYVSSRSPVANAILVPVGNSITATFNTTMNSGTINSTNFTLKNGSTSVSATVSYNSGTRTATLTPTSSLAAGTTYTVTLSGVHSSAGTTMPTTTWSFTTAGTADITAPTVSAQTPASGATGVPFATNVMATFSENVQASTISFVLKNGSTTVPATVTYDVTSRIVTLDPTANLAAGTTYTATLSGAQDLTGNTMTSTSWSFTTAAADIAPTVSAQAPANGATGVPIASNVTATFSEALVPGTISFVLKTGSTTVPSTVTYDVTSRIVTLDPSSNLAAATTYTATLSGAQDLSGTTMTSTSWSFTTAAANTTAPTVTVQSPGSSATGVAIASRVTATLSEQVQAGMISFVLKNGSTTVAASVSYNPANQTATLTPSASLAYATTYTATLSGAQDLSGNAMSTVSWSFTTTSAPDTTAPTVTAQSPAPSATGVAIASPVTVTFSEEIQASTISFVLKNGSTTDSGDGQLQPDIPDRDLDSHCTPVFRDDLHRHFERRQGPVGEYDVHRLLVVHDQLDSRYGTADGDGPEPRLRCYGRGGRQQRDGHLQRGRAGRHDQLRAQERVHHGIGGGNV